MHDEIFIPFIVFASVFGYLAFRRWMEYRETIALAAQGLVMPRESGDGKDSLRWGIALAALGLALCAGLYPVGWYVGEHFPFGIGPWLLPGFILLFLGLGLVLIYLVTHPRNENDANEARSRGNVPGGGAAAAAAPVQAESGWVAPIPASPPSAPVRDEPES